MTHFEFALDLVIEMLVEAGFVSQQKVDEARAFLRKL